MRIALLSYEYPAETGFGGIGTYTWTQARALAALGHDVEVLAGGTGPEKSPAERHDGVLVRRRGDRSPAGLGARLLGALGWWWSRNRLENGRRMRRLLDEAEAAAPFDIVEFPDCGAEALRLDNRAGARRLARFHSPAELIMPLYETRAGDRRLCAALERRSLRRATAYSSCSMFLAREAQRLGLSQGAPIATVPNGIEAGPLPPGGTEWRRLLGLAAERAVLLWSGRLEPRKGVALLCRLAPEILSRRNLALVVAGDDLFGHGARELAARSEGAGWRGSLHLLGRQSGEKVRELLALADVVWIPSRWESCPYAVLEAMACGGGEAASAAILASEVGGVPELIRDGEEGRLAPPDDLAAHLSILEALLDAPEERRRLGSNARRRVASDFSSRRTAERSLELYRAVAPRGGRRAR